MYHGTEQTERHICIFMEYMPGVNKMRIYFIHFFRANEQGNVRFGRNSTRTRKEVVIKEYRSIQDGCKAAENCCVLFVFFRRPSMIISNNMEPLPRV